MFAFGFHGVVDRELRYDPRFVRYIVRMQYVTESGETRESLMGHHLCTDDDYEKFYPIEPARQSKFQQLKEKGLLCVDWDNENPILLYGGDMDRTSQIFEVILSPCNYLHNEITLKETSFDAQCEINAKKQFEYLSSSIDLHLVYN